MPDILLPAAAQSSTGPLGVLGYAEVTASQTDITTEVDLTGLSVTVTVGTSRRIKITAHTRPAASADATVTQLNIKEGATLLTQDRMAQDGTGGGFRQLISHVVLTPSAGSHTYKLTMVRDGGSGTIISTAGSNVPAFILVEDIGAA